MKRIFTFLALCALSVQANAQGNFESWRNYTAGGKSLEKAEGWRCPDSLAAVYGVLIGGSEKQLFKSTDAHGGSAAARVVSRPQGNLGVVPGILTNAEILVDISTTEFSLRGGAVISGKVDYMDVWVKYTPQGGDSANVGVRALIADMGADGGDSVVGVGLVKIGGTIANYTLFSVPIVYLVPGAIPNRLQFIFASSDATEMLSGGASTATDGSELLVDDVTYGTFPVGINTVAGNNNVVKCYPVPAGNTLYVANTSNKELQWQAFDITGRMVLNRTITGTTTVDVASLTAGMYIYKVMDATGAVLQKGEFSIAR